MTWLDRLRGMRRPATTVADQALVSIANFATVFLFARSLPPGDFGLLAVVLSVFLATTAIQTAMIGQVHNLLGARRHGRDFRSLTGHLLLVQLLLMTVVAIPAATMGGILLMTGGARVGEIVIVSSVVLVPWLFQDTVRRFLYTKRRMSWVLLNDGLCYGIQLVGAVLISIGMLPQTFDAAMGVYFAACIAGAVVGSIQFRLMGLRIDRRNWQSDVREAWGVGRFLAGAEVLGLVGKNTTSWMLAAFMGLPALGAYRASVQIANVLNPLMSASGLYLPALTSARWAEGSPAAYTAWFRRLSLILTSLLGVAVLGMTLAAGPVLQLAYSGRYDAYPVVAILQITLAVRLIGFLHDTLFHGLVGAGEERAVVMDRVLQLVILAVAGVPLVKNFGGEGVAIWHLLSVSILTWFAVYRFRKLGIRSSDRAHGTQAAGGGHVGGHATGTIGSGAEGIVTLNPDGRTVSKRFTRMDRAPGRAQTEYRLLKKLSAAADRAPISFRSPRPISFLRSQNTIVMERCPGLPLDDYLLARRPNAPELNRISTALADGLTHIVGTLRAPYHDFCPQNVLWDGDTGTMTALDLGNHHITSAGRLPREPFAVSLGCFLGRTIYTAARPARLGRFGDLLRNARLYRDMEAGVRRRGVPLHRGEVTRVALSRFVAMGMDGSLPRRIWYFSVGIPLVLLSLGLSFMGPGTGAVRPSQAPADPGTADPRPAEKHPGTGP